MLNLRQSNKSEQASSTGSGARHFSRFSISFRMPGPDLLGNIGEPLDHDLSEQPHEDDDPETISALADSAEEMVSSVAESPNPTGERSGRESENRGEDVTAILEVARQASDFEILLENRVVSNTVLTPVLSAEQCLYLQATSSGLGGLEV